MRRFHNSFGPCEKCFFVFFGVHFGFFFCKKIMFLTHAKGFLRKKGPNLPDFEIFKKQFTRFLK